MGAYAAERHIDAFFAIGEHMRYAVEKFRELSPQARSLWMDDRYQFMEAVIEESHHCRTVSVKGSNCMKLTTVVKALVVDATKNKKD